MFKNRILIAVPAFALIAGSGPLCAQDIDRIKPKLLDDEGRQAAVVSEIEPVDPDVETMPDPLSAEEYESFGTVAGIALLDHPDKVQAENPPNVNGVTAPPDFTIPDEVIAAVEPYISTSLNITTVENLTKAILLSYKKAGFPVVDVGFPEQNVSSGVLQVVVIVGRLGKVSVEGNEYFDDHIYLEQFLMAEGEDIRHDLILEDLRYLNRNPFRQVDLAYTPGDEFGEADIILSASELRPLTAYLGFENTGNETVGSDRFLFGFEAGNLWNRDHILGYQFTTPVDFENLYGHALTYRAPSPWNKRHEFRFLGAYVESDVSLPGTDEVLTTGGESLQFEWAIPLSPADLARLDARSLPRFRLQIDEQRPRVWWQHRHRFDDRDLPVPDRSCRRQTRQTRSVQFPPQLCIQPGQLLQSQLQRFLSATTRFG